MLRILKSININSTVNDGCRLPIFRSYASSLRSATGADLDVTSILLSGAALQLISRRRLFIMTNLLLGLANKQGHAEQSYLLQALWDKCANISDVFSLKCMALDTAEASQQCCARAHPLLLYLLNLQGSRTWWQHLLTNTPNVFCCKRPGMLQCFAATRVLV